VNEVASETYKDICEKWVYGGTPITNLAKQYKISDKQIKRILEEHADYIAELKHERKMHYKAKYDSMTKLSMRCLKEIMQMSHLGEDNEGRPKIDKDILKLKKEIAERQLETFGVIKSKGGGININQQFNGDLPKLDKEKHIKEILDSCVIEEKSSIIEPKVIDVTSEVLNEG
jgi:MoxR-like ATPase